MSRRFRSVFGTKRQEGRCDPIGSGGEAEVFDLGGGIALKRFKPPAHPDYAHSPFEQRAAAARLAEHQRKIPELMRLALPDRVAAPIDVVRDANGAITGYTMPLVSNAEPLMRYGDRTFREQGGLTTPRVIPILAGLHRTVVQLHATGVVIGDFNDLNVLVQGTEAHLIDIDSAQFGPFLSTLFTARFLDPRLTDGQTLAPVRPHDRDSDWFAFAVMVFRTLLLVDPFGGIHHPANGGSRVAQDARSLRRLSVLHPDVIAPKHAYSFQTLPADVLRHFDEIFSHDRRGEFPIALLTSLQPAPTAAPSIGRPMQIVRGRITAQEVFMTSGVIVATALDHDRLLWLEHRDGEFRREDGTVAFRGPLDPRLRFALERRATIVLRGDEVLILHQGMERLRATSLATNARHRYWLDSGTLYRDGSVAPEAIGSVLGGLTRFWVGDTFGFGFYRANAMTVAFVFDAESRGIRDGVNLPHIGGQLIDANAVFTSDLCWLFLALQEGGRIRHRCTVIRRDGSIEATHEEEPGEGSWLARLHGKAAAGGFLLSATDDGIVRVEPHRGGLNVTKVFFVSETFVGGTTRLLIGADCLYAVNAVRIQRLRIT